ncbi:arabinosyltransferase domain-containing protein [Gordonia crocea]|uniref:Putative arabinosyltransferase C n=1 Tax=Gordonia crocea TaxID=589162 RepID=A0A7M3SUM1_9ACTN|nr:arabinosyltransferase domain-containing protein [Gordonia crocea]GED96345.1 putative arabinosyltransferase C [Gordonia crocea]
MPAQTLRRARIAAIVTGLAGFLLALATPLLPVNQATAELSWPQRGELRSVNAPLIAYVPIDMRMSIPCSAVDRLGPDGSVLLSTVPKQAAPAPERGLFVQRSADKSTVSITVRNIPVASAPTSEVAGPKCRSIDVTATADAVTATFTGLTNADGSPLSGTTAGRDDEHLGADQRPQLTGFFTDLTGPASSEPGLSARANLDTRYETPATLIKRIALIVGILATIASLAALAILDSSDRRGHRRILPARWWHLRLRDYIVLGALLVWHFVGPNTSDDGYLLTMSRVGQETGYTANYFRWFGAPEAPFGWYYSVFGWLSEVNLSSPWLRLPALACGVAVWLILSHEVLPRLGRAAAAPVVGATAAAAFLAMWFPFDNGLRPEPIICLGALLTWCSVERAIATGRLLPAAIACTIGAFSLAAGPTGLLAVAALIAGARPMILALIKRARDLDAQVFGTPTARWRTVGTYLSLLAPILAAGTFVVFIVFSNLTLRAFGDASTMKTALGPSMHWYNEIDRYSSLFEYSANGSIARRFAVLVLLLSLAVSAAMLLRKGRIPGTASGPTRRIVGIVFGSLLFLMFTPTKWTHHFGVFAGLGAALAAIAAIAVSHQAMRSRRNRTIFAALALFIGGLAFTAPNSYFYSSSWGMPWGVEQVTLGFRISSALLFASLALLALALLFHLREPFTGTDPHEPVEAPSAPLTGWARLRTTLASEPLVFVIAAVVVFQVATAVMAGVRQSSSYSVPRSNLEALRGVECGMAEKVWTEIDPSRFQLAPVDRSLSPAQALAGPRPAPGSDPSAAPTDGFTPDGVPTGMVTNAAQGSLGVLADAANDDPGVLAANSGGTSGGLTDKPGINGSHARLPFFLDPARTPVLGSYSAGAQAPARLHSAWYALPRDFAQQPLITFSAAGWFERPDLVLEYSTTPVTDATRDGALTVAGSIPLIDPGPRPSWRNVRLNTDALPADTTAVRIVARDDNLGADRYIVVTPPRLPHMQTLQQVVGKTDPVHVDWTSGLVFPCQRPFVHHNGVAEIPKWRIRPGADLAAAVSTWQSAAGGGPLGWLEVSQRPETVATYLKGDIGRDWGALEAYRPYDPTSVTPAELTTGSHVRSGLWRPAPIRH